MLRGLRPDSISVADWGIVCRDAPDMPKLGSLDMSGLHRVHFWTRSVANRRAEGGHWRAAVLTRGGLAEILGLPISLGSSP